MNIDFTKKNFFHKEANFILTKLYSASQKGFIEKRYENNSCLLASFRGIEEKGITPKWNVKIYMYNQKKQGYSIVCVDTHILENLVKEDYESFIPPSLKVLQIDDAGWGFPLCGVMVGVSDGEQIKTKVVTVEYFQEHFQTKLYLEKYASLAIEILDEFHASFEQYRIEICTGHVNKLLKEQLREKGYDVRVTEIKGLLQDTLEELFRKYVIEDIGSDIYYDPKNMEKNEISKIYKKALEFGKKYYPHKIKSGWSSISININ
ncbi:MAG: hypothetical protein ABIB46_00010 [bacterium]